MSIPNLSESMIRHHATSKSFQRGEDYYHQGAIIEVCQRGDQIQAAVEGNEAEPYVVQLAFDAGGVTQVSCTCPYDFEGWCKHLIATALLCVRQPDRIQQRPALNQLLEQLDRVQMQNLLQILVDEQPSLMNSIDRFVSQMTRPQPATSARTKRQTAVDPQPYRYQAQRLMRETLSYWEEGDEYDPIANELPTLIAQAQAFTEQGEGNSALVILEAITQACAEDWEEIADYGGNGEDLIRLLDPAWTEAILSADFQSGEEMDLQVNLEDWERQLGGCFELSAAALRQGWDDPDLIAVLQGQSANLWEDSRPDCADLLAQIQLRILKRQGRQDEYLNLAHVEGQIQEYLIMLTQLGRITDVMAACKQLTYVEQALEVAKGLREHGALAEALAIAQHGLTLPEAEHLSPSWYMIGQIEQYQTPGFGFYQLADWTSELAEGLGNLSVALSARIEAFKARPSFGDYQKVETLAGENWLTLKSELIQELRQRENWVAAEAKVTIFLHEGLIDDAIATVDSYGARHLLRQVMVAAIPHQPDWVIVKARRQAEDIMDRGKSSAYEAAVDWLRQAREAYLHCDRRPEWQHYHAQLMNTHARKRKLMALLKEPNLR
jgi:uncharacterized Zn finger protein